MTMRAILLGFLFLASPVSGKSEVSISGVGEAPEKGIHDPGAWLEPVKKAELEANHTDAFEKWGMKVFVVIVPARPPGGVDVFSREVGREWSGEGTWGVLTHVIGDPESPWCYGERGNDLRWSKGEEFERVLASARRRARREPDPVLSVMVGARELTDELGFLGIVSKRRYQMFGESQPSEVSQEVISKRGKMGISQVLMIVFPLLLTVAIAGLILIRRMSKKSPRSFEFPETAPRHRFCGPWSGGGNVIVNFVSKDSEIYSRKR